MAYLRNWQALLTTEVSGAAPAPRPRSAPAAGLCPQVQRLRAPGLTPTEHCVPRSHTPACNGNVQLRERIEDEPRSQDQPKVEPKKELPDPAGVLGEVTTFRRAGQGRRLHGGDRRVHRTRPHPPVSERLP
jgi:hypothetical protein